MSENDWKVIGNEDDDVKLIWKGDKDKGLVYVRMKIKGSGRWFVFEGGLKFKCIEEEESVLEKSE